MSASAKPHVRVERSGSLATVFLDRPERANALSSQTAKDLAQAIQQTVTDDVRVVVIRGNQRVFCAGADLDEMKTLDAISAEAFIRGLHLALRNIREHPAPVIAVIQGPALGAGLELVMACDLAIASDDAILGMPETQVGIPSVIEAALMPSIVGLARTRELLLTGESIDAHEAFRIGLINRVVTSQELEQTVAERVAQLAALSPIGLASQKALIRRWLNLPMDEAIEAGIRAFAMAMASGNPQQIMAELRKR
jgi:enoyl-CoA hydratase/carnithine racemase